MFGQCTMPNNIVGIREPDDDTMAHPVSGIANMTKYNHRSTNFAPIFSQARMVVGNGGNVLSLRHNTRSMLKRSTEIPMDLCSWRTACRSGPWTAENCQPM